MLGFYLAQFSWRRLCKIKGVDAFDQILKDIAKFYDSNGWKNYGEAFEMETLTTERKQRQAMRKGVNLVRGIICY